MEKLERWNAISERVVSVCRAYAVHDQAFGLMMAFLCAIYGQSVPGGHAPPVFALWCCREKPQHIVLTNEVTVWGAGCMAD
jgi:hypothetical protein